MSTQARSDFRFEKHRNRAVILLSTGETVDGNFFTGSANLRRSGPERIGDLLNAEGGFFPFEVLGENGPRTLIYNRAYLVTVTVSSDEPHQEPGYDVATPKSVSMLLSTGERLSGSIRVYQPEGYHRLSDWSRTRNQFHYLETDTCALLVNGAHVVEVSEVESHQRTAVPPAARRV
jgi:hypothetical protein